ncbi:helix-turn-helix transcriptional regulator [Actinoplanes sp. OR16]|uniref:helix-turn-helix domain-containing protein n=1 Tax=Actinoplanes sp. OR16 TaxID=946334 RepID=UPI001E488740|nr:helix-turn-helix transcriptional regulator [Actinoplanes sp. OR16]
MQPSLELAARLRQLRKSQWPDVSITQTELAKALSHRKPASLQLISSWERAATPPPEDRLDAISTFFSTRRSIQHRPYQLISEQELTADEAATRDRLKQELLALREAALAESDAVALTAPPARPSIVGRGPWHYKEGPIVIVCAEPGTGAPQPIDPDRSKLSRFADLDSLFELHGHIRAVNPDLEVRFLSAREMQEDDWTAHLVLLGGIDWNDATQDAMRLTPVPVTQLSDDDDPSRGCFQVVVEGRDRLSFVPEFENRGGARVLVQDVGHFFRAPNPLNRERTITVCNGMYGSGVYGAVRTLTHDVFREKNAEYLASHFDGRTFSLLFRVQVLTGIVTTPDWTAPDTVLHSWPEV